LTSQPRGRYRWVLYFVVLLGSLIAAAATEQALAYDGPSVEIPGLPLGIESGLKTYPWFYTPVWPTATTFGIGVTLIIGALIGLRLTSSSGSGAHLVWAAIAVCGVGIAIQFVGIELEATTSTGVIPFLVGIFGIFITICALPVLIAGVGVVTKERSSRRSAN
jgi:hypothetical protein